ncbi:MAG: hypothetical protein U9Q98_07210 [Bacteroidota bacterium]|nr:hypothetical protein [Bacteroidota bacterium]
MDTDYSHTSGTITINASGTLSSGSPDRGFSINYPNGTANLTVDGTFQIARTMLNSGNVTNNGTIDADSLLNSAFILVFLTSHHQANSKMFLYSQILPVEFCISKAQPNWQKLKSKTSLGKIYIPLSLIKTHS